MEPAQQMKILGGAPVTEPFHQRMNAPLHACRVGILQINTGRRCNLSCRHCHLSAGPQRHEIMGREVFEQCLGVLKKHPQITTIDITGGAPEMNPHLASFIEQACTLERRLMVRSNLAILAEQAYAPFLDVYLRNKVEIVASLPDFRAERSDRQRGRGSFDKVLAVMRRLNDAGYGMPGSGLVLNLVHNPVGNYLPGAQHALEHEYRMRLESAFGLRFNTLFCLTNAPLGRYLEYLIESDNFDNYMHALGISYNHATLDNLMCRDTISVGWDGRLYDCDFNQALNLEVACRTSAHIDAFDYEQLSRRAIVTGNHCYSCTAGAGSSCQGVIQK